MTRVFVRRACHAPVLASICQAITRCYRSMHQSFENQIQRRAYNVSYNTSKRRCFFCPFVWFYA